MVVSFGRYLSRAREQRKAYLRAPLLSGFNAIIANKALTRITRDAFDLNDGSANSDETKQKAGVCPQGGGGTVRVIANYRLIRM